MKTNRMKAIVSMTMCAALGCGINTAVNNAVSDVTDNAKGHNETQPDFSEQFTAHCYNGNSHSINCNCCKSCKRWW